MVEACYRASTEFPAGEKFGLTAQLRRAAASVPANIAEGRGRGGEVEFARFLSIALGSLAELDTLLELARRLNYLRPADYARLQDEVDQLSRMLNALIHRIRPRNTKAPPAR